MHDAVDSFTVTLCVYCVCAGLCYTTTIAVLCCAVAMNFSMSNQITKMNECSINGIEYAVICCIARYESESRAFCLHIRCVCMVAGMRLSQTAFFVRYIADQLIIVYKMFDWAASHPTHTVFMCAIPWSCLRIISFDSRLPLDFFFVVINEILWVDKSIITLVIVVCVGWWLYSN